MSLTPGQRERATGLMARAIDENRLDAEKSMFNKVEWLVLSCDEDELARELDALRAHLFPEMEQSA